MTDTTALARYEAAMTRALELAARGPVWGVNPQVGCVILDAAGQVIAEGWHQGAGTAHAEVDALSKLAPGQAQGATAIVTLEPCNHTGRTGPCSHALRDAGVARVVYAVGDPNPNAQGGGSLLAAAGVDVIAGVGRAEAEALLHGWLTANRLGRPFVTVKWAQSLDGRAAANDGSSQWITGAAARSDVHRRRTAHGAIVAGVGTVLADNPSLTARADDGRLLDHQPIPVIIGERAIPESAAVLQHPVDALVYPTRDLHAVLADLWQREVRSVFVEGGPTLASAFIAAGLVDEVLIYQAPVLLGGSRSAVGNIGVDRIDQAIRLRVTERITLGEDQLTVARPIRQQGTDSQSAGTDHTVGRH